MTSRTTAGVVVITGASSGLGAEMARQFSALNYDLALAWPWFPLGVAMKVLPLPIARRLT